MKINIRFRKIAAAAALSFALFSTVFCAAAFAEERTQMVLEYDGALHSYDAPAITLSINGEVVPSSALNMPPVIVNDRTYVPARDVFEKMGAVVDWKELTREVFIGYGDSLVILRIDDPALFVDGEMIVADVAPKIINNRTMIPVKFASEALGFTVGWHEPTRLVSIADARTAAVVTEPSAPPRYPDSIDGFINDTYDPPDDEGAGGMQDQTNDDFNLGEELAKDVSKKEIEAAKYPLTTIKDIIVPVSAAEDTFRVIASSEISRVKKTLLPDNRLVIDLFNAEIDLPKSEYDLPDNGYIARVRTGQNQVTPEMVSRIVFDLSASVNYSVGLSTDRKEVTVRFERNQISDVAFSSDGAADYITVRGDTRPVTSVFTLTNPDRLVIDVPLGVINEQERAENGVFATTIRTAQFESSTARIVVDVKRTPAFEVSYEGNVTKIKITEPTYRNIAFDPEKKALVLPKIGGQVLVLQQITETDRYDENKYIFNLNADYSGLLGYGDYRIGDDWINSINIQTKGGKTELTVNQNRILSYDISEDANNIYIKPISPKEKYDFVVIIDPGHGGAHTGTRGNGLEEEALNLAISQKLVAMLEADGRVKVYATRTSDAHLNTDLSTDLLMRSAIANTTGDVFISIHHNSFSATSNGTETYYDKGNNTQVGGASRQMADIIQKNLLEELGFTDREVQTNDYSVLRHTKIPAVLAEIGFVSNPEEAAKLATDEYQTKAAKAIFEAIMELFEIYQPKR